MRPCSGCVDGGWADWSGADTLLVSRAGDRVRFDVVIHRAGEAHTARESIETDIVRRSRVKSSFGASHARLFVETTLRLGPVEKKVQLGLVCRKNLLCRMLLGRAALSPDFVVDSARRYVFGTHRERPARRPKTGSERPPRYERFGDTGDVFLRYNKLVSSPDETPPDDTNPDEIGGE